MNVLITGGKGYLGSKIAFYLSSNTNFNVYVSSRSSDERFFPSNIKTIKIQWDFDDIIKLENNKFDIVIHCAGINALDSAKDPIGAFKFNALGTGKLVLACKNANVKKFIYFSTAHVYSSPLVGDIIEETLTQNIHPYATSHRAAEDFVISSHLDNGMQCCCLRLSNSFGAPYDRSIDCWGLFLNDICRQVISTGAIELKSNGSQYRNFITLTDVCSAISHLIKVDLSNEICPIYNLGGSWNTSIFDASRLVANIYSESFDRPIPIIKLNKDKITTGLGALNFISKKIEKTGFYLSNNYNEEVQQLLKYCIQTT
jgi:UDP-glucose 4-epimerase